MLNTLESPGELQTRCSLKTGQTISSVSKYLSHFTFVLNSHLSLFPWKELFMSLSKLSVPKHQPEEKRSFAKRLAPSRFPYKRYLLWLLKIFLCASLALSEYSVCFHKVHN